MAATHDLAQANRHHGIEHLQRELERVSGMEKTNRLLIKALARRLDALERGDPPEPIPTPDALRPEDI